MDEMMMRLGEPLSAMRVLFRPQHPGPSGAEGWKICTFTK